MLASVHLKIYDYSATEDQVQRKKKFKKKFVSYYRAKRSRKEEKARQPREQPNNRDKSAERQESEKKTSNRSSAAGDHDDHELENDPIFEEEVKLIKEFLSSFVLASESGSNFDQIDVKLALKAVPSKVDEYNYFMCNVFNFESTKESLIAFQNDNQDELFKYYDNRNKARLNKLNLKATITKDQTLALKELGSTVLSILKKIKHEGEKRAKGEEGRRVPITSTEVDERADLEEQAPLEYE